jgi:lysozyme family protein
MNFDQASERVRPIEGGYVNNPADPGRETNMGITWPVLHEAIGLGIVPAGTTIADLVWDQAKVIYKALFWDRGHMDEYDGAIAYQAYDAAVNSGIGNANRFLQRAAGVADDGDMGPITIAAIKALPVPHILALFIAARLEFCTMLSAWQTFSKGWARRAVADIRYAVIDWEQEQTP